ncbi:tetratricopeptide repeat protein [Nocardia niwae]|uniref:tetratricopeptide repeat protein n=1 Tax=Nocardia niwae TaxID=626084 RepID=UPI0007A53840|nr:tetratricopeptide repeat protein [Nocardia niwae]
MSNPVAGRDITIQYFAGSVDAPPVRLSQLVERLGAEGELPMVADLNPYAAGATATRFGAAGEDPYVPRTHGDVDIRLDAALREDALVLVVGPSKTGKTRSLFEAARRVLGEARLLIPAPAALADIPGCAQFTDGAETVVVWLENLDRFLTADRPLTPALLARLTARPARTVVAATLRSEARNRLRQGTGEFSREIGAVLQQATTIQLAPTSDDPHEHAAAAAAYPSLRLGRYGLAEILAGAPELLARYDDARYGDPALHTVLQVAVDWVRVGRPDPIPETVLAELASAALADQRPELDLDAAAVHAAIAAARAPLAGEGHVAALHTSRLPDRSRAYRPFDYLVAADDGQHFRNARPLPDVFWRNADRDADPAVLASVGFTAYVRDRRLDSEHLLYRAACAGHLEAAYNLGVLLHERGAHADAEHWWRRAGVAGHAPSTYRVGVLLDKRGATDEAETWYRSAAVSYPQAMTVLAAVLFRRGRTAEGEVWFRRAAVAGHPDAMSVLGALLDDRGETVEAEEWWRRAAARQQTEAMHHLAMLEDRSGRAAEAEAWYRRAAATGHTGAAYDLGVLLHRRGETREAETEWRRAAAHDHLLAIHNLAASLHVRGEITEAESWYRRAVAAGHANAMHNLAVLLMSRDQIAEAESWFRRAAATGHPDAMLALAAVLENRGESREAEVWYHRSATAGDPEAMFALAVALQRRNRTAEAEKWYRRAAAAEHPKAAHRLGYLLHDRGEVDGAEQVWRAAAAHDPDCMFVLGIVVERRGETAEAEGWYRRAAAAGHLEAMRLLAGSLRLRGEAAEADAWERRAAQGAAQD